MAAPTLRTGAANTNTAPATLSITVGSAPVAGEIIEAFMIGDFATNTVDDWDITSHTGFEEVLSFTNTNNYGFKYWIKRAGVGESATFTCTAVEINRRKMFSVIYYEGAETSNILLPSEKNGGAGYIEGVDYNTVEITPAAQRIDFPTLDVPPNNLSIGYGMGEGAVSTETKLDSDYAGGFYTDNFRTMMRSRWGNDGSLTTKSPGFTWTTGNSVTSGFHLLLGDPAQNSSMTKRLRGY